VGERKAYLVCWRWSRWLWCTGWATLLYSLLFLFSFLSDRPSLWFLCFFVFLALSVWSFLCFFSWVLCFFSCLLFSLFSSWSPCSGPSLAFYRAKNIISQPYLPGDGDEDHYYSGSVFGWNENTNSPAIVGLLVINFILAPEAHRRDEGNWNTRAICGRQPGLWFWLGSGEISEGIGSGRCHFWQFSRTNFPLFQRKGRMNSGLKNGVVYSAEMSIFNLPPEVLTFSN